MHKTLITGANGQLGRDLVHELTGRGVQCIASDIQKKFSGQEECEYIQLDITDYDAVREALNLAMSGDELPHPDLPELSPPGLSPMLRGWGLPFSVAETTPPDLPFSGAGAHAQVPHDKGGFMGVTEDGGFRGVTEDGDNPSPTLPMTGAGAHAQVPPDKGGYRGVTEDVGFRGGTANGGKRGGTPPCLTHLLIDRGLPIAGAERMRVIHCAAWTAVDSAEDKTNREKVYSVNVTGTENIARVCAETGSIMTYISTDYIFDGTDTRAWQPDDTNYSPLNYYGFTKLQGELAVKKYLQRFFIVRIAWVFGANGNNFVRTMLNLAKTHDTLRVVNDQIGTPTYTPDLARLLADMDSSDKFGIYHATNEGGFISWYDFAREIFSQAGVNVNVIPVTTQEYGLSKAKRPYNSRLDKSKLITAGFTPLPDWRDALRRYLANGTN